MNNTGYLYKMLAVNKRLAVLPFSPRGDFRGENHVANAAQ